MKPLTPLIFCLALIVGFAAPFGGCKDDTIQPPPTTVPVLSLLDKNCTEAWINVKASLLPAASGINTLSVTQGNRRLLSLSLPHPDTVPYISSLLPSRSYGIRSERQYSGISYTDSSEHFTFTPLDTTSHNFTW